MHKALGCTLLSAVLAGGVVAPAIAAPATAAPTVAIPVADKPAADRASGSGTVQALALSPAAAARLRPTLKVGARTPAVVFVQQALGVKPASGYYGPITRAAVRKLQKANGLKATGAMNRKTWKLLEAAPVAPSTETTAATTDAAAPVEVTPAAAPVATLTPEQAAAAQPALRYGMGPGDQAVVFVQTFLGVTPVTGYFGTRTKAAVTAYQKALGISATGTVGPKTWAAILAGTKPPAAAVTEPAPAETPAPVTTPEATTATAPTATSVTTTPATTTGTIATPTYTLPAQPAARDLALVFALAQVGKRYVLGGNGPDVFDCSGLVQQAYLTAGIKLPRRASLQRFAGTEVPIDQLLPGDLLYYQDGPSTTKGHISMYAGNGLVVEAANPRRGVRIRTLNETWYAKRFVAAIRVG